MNLIGDFELSHKLAYNVEALAMWRHSVFRLPATAAKFITKSSLFVLLLGVIHLPKLKPISE